MDTVTNHVMSLNYKVKIEIFKQFLYHVIIYNQMIDSSENMKISQLKIIKTYKINEIV